MKNLLLPAFLLLPTLLGAQSPLESTFVGGLVLTNTAPPPVTMLFDVTIVDPAGVTVRQIDVNCNLSAGNNGTLGVWITAVGGTHVGNQVIPAAWTQVATATRTHTGGRTAFVLPTPFYLAPGTYGIALYHEGANPVYTNPATPVPPLPTSYSNLEGTLQMVSARARGCLVGQPFGGTAAGNTPRHANVALHYVSGRVAVDFVGTPLRGASPLQVQFTSYVASANPGGITALLWDFDNDGNVDSTLPNPTYTYNTCGNYTVSLTMVDGAGSYNVTKTNYVQTDVIVPSFTNQLVAANTVQFTDTSSPAPQTWSWDLNGDNVPDSNLQNPVFVYPSGCSEVNVTLTVTRACQPAVVFQKRIAVATTIETTFQAGLIISAAATGGTTFVDANVTNAMGVTICGMHVNSNVAAASPVTVKVHQRAGTYSGFVENAAQWRLVGTGTVNSLGYAQRTFVAFNPPIHLAVGLHGLGIELVGGSPGYTNLGGVQTYTNGDLSITAGLVQLSPIFGPAATSTQFTPRIGNLAFHYATTQTNGAAGYGYIGAGCAGTLGVPGNTVTTQPVLGGGATMVIDKMPFGIGVMALGTTRFPLPFDLGIINMPGCPLYATADATVTIVGAPPTASLTFPVPNNNVFIGTKIFTQALSLDIGLNPFGFSISDAAVMLVGL
ncbi:MAG: PKD domain-containing protein [Planctomycetota bacterium]